MILWRRLDIPGHELADLRQARHGWELAGTALLAHAGRPCRLDYVIDCDPSWRTRSATVRANIGGAERSLHVLCDETRAWTVNGEYIRAASGCVDIDLGFSPSTNLLPIRRLRLAIGATADVRAAWVRFPELTLEVLDQKYIRQSATTYHYESANGAFRRELTVDADGFVTDYPGLWLAEATSQSSNAKEGRRAAE